MNRHKGTTMWNEHALGTWPIERAHRAWFVALAIVLAPSWAHAITAQLNIADSTYRNGEAFTATVTVSDVGTFARSSIEAVELLIQYQESDLEFLGARAGAMLLGGPNPPVLFSTDVQGQLRAGIAVIHAQPLSEGGVVIEVDFRVRGGAVPGTSDLDLVRVEFGEEDILIEGADASGETISVLPGVGNLVLADVTPNSLSVIWSSNTAVAGAGVRVFTDPSAQSEITDTLQQEFVSPNFPPAATLGIVKVTLSGLAASSTIFVRTETTRDDGVVIFPAAGSLPGATTQSSNTATSAFPVTHTVVGLDGATPGIGMLVLVRRSNEPSQHPISAFAPVGSGGAVELDLNQLYVAGQSDDVTEGEILRLTEYRGNVCPLQEQNLARFRRAPVPAETLSGLEKCFVADTVCDDVINVLDFPDSGAPPSPPRRLAAWRNVSLRIRFATT